MVQYTEDLKKPETETTTMSSYKERLKASKDYCEPHWERAIDNYKHYLGRLDVGGINESDYPFTSTLSLPISYDVVETVFPRIIGKKPEYNAVAVEPGDVEYEQTAKLTVQSEYENPKLELLGEPIYLKLQRAVKEKLITGNYVLRPYWRRENKKRMKYFGSLERAGIKNSEDLENVYKVAGELDAKDEIEFTKEVTDSPFLDDFDVRHIPFFHFFPDGWMTETGRMRYKIEREFMTYDELVDEAIMFEYSKEKMDEITDMVDEGKVGFTPDVDKDFMSEYNDLFSNVGEGTTGSDDDRVSLLVVDKMWENGEKVHVVANEKFQLTEEGGMENPYDVKIDPFIFAHDVVMPHSYFSRSEVDAIKKLEDAATDMWNMRYDNLLQSMLNMWLVNPNFIAEGDEFVPIPGSITTVTDTERVLKQVTGADVTTTANKEAESIIQLVRAVTGTDDYVKGIEGDQIGGRSYGGMRLIQEMANARFIVKSRLHEEVSLKSLGYFILEMSRQFISEERVVRLTGASGDVETGVINPAALKLIKGYMDMRVIPNSAMVIDQQAEAMKLNAVADRFVTEKGPFANIPNEVYDKFLLKFLSAYNIHDAVYWVREIRKARQGATEEGNDNGQGATPTPPTGPAPPQGGPDIQQLAQVLQSDQVAQQPSVDQQLTNAQALPGVGQGMPTGLPGIPQI